MSTREHTAKERSEDNLNLPFEERIARVAHEANRAYCVSIGDDSQPEWKDAPDWQKSSAVNGVQFHLAELKAGRDPKPEASHENWLAQKRAEGWTYGHVKDPAKKEHPCFMPYHGLPLDQRMKDYIFAAIVRAFHQGSADEASMAA